MSGWRAALLLLLAAAPAARAADVRVIAAPYLAARDAGAVGVVDVEAWAEPSRPAGPAAPRAGLPVLLLPYSPEVWADLETVKRGQRDSLDRYMEAAGRVAAARGAWEQALLEAGAGDLVRGEVTGPAGTVRLAEVPAGPWLLLAWREEAQAARGGRPRRSETLLYPGLTVTTGFTVVTYWRLRLEVRAGESVSVGLHDRNGWLTVVREESRPAGTREGPGRR